MKYYDSGYYIKTLFAFVNKNYDKSGNLFSIY